MFESLDLLWSRIKRALRDRARKRTGRAGRQITKPMIQYPK